MMVHMKTILVTGAGGFLGSHLMLHHLKAGDTVLGVDNHSSSQANSAHVNLIKSLCGPHNRSVFAKVDINERGVRGLDGVVSDYFSWMPGRKFDVIYNFACPASPPRYQAIPVETMLTCTMGVVNILELAKYHSSIVVHASTSEVYGDPDVNPQPESYRGNVNSYGPRACYDEGKRAAEALCYDYLNKYGVDARMVRIFNTYGPHMDPYDGRVVSNFICQALRGEQLTVFGDGSQTRSFCYVDDLIRGIVSLGSLKQNPKSPINLGNPEEFTVKQLALKVSQKILGEEKPVLFKELPVDDPTQRKPDITLANKILDWQPRITLDLGLDRTIDYFRNF